MILGRVQDKFPRVVLPVSGLEETIRVEFIVDTGFDGALAVPANILRFFDSIYIGNRTIFLADKTPREGAYYHVFVEWEGEPRTMEATLMEGRPLLGYEAMEGGLLQVEVSDGGEVSIDMS